MKRPPRLAVVVSHPIQYQVPLFRRLASNPNLALDVFFCSDRTARQYHDAGFARNVQWDVPLLSGYRYRVMRNFGPFPYLEYPFGLVNPWVIPRVCRGDYDAVWVHGWNYFTAWMAMVAAKMRGIPLILRGETNLLKPLSPWHEQARRLILKPLLRSAAAVFAIGRYNAEFYEAYGVPKSKIFLTPYSVDNEYLVRRHMELRAQRSKLKRDLGLRDDVPIVLFSGKLTPKKRPMDLVRAFEACAKSVPGTLVFMGDGPLRSRMEGYCHAHHLDEVLFVGFQNQTGLPRYYEIADIFVLPSGAEPWGLVVNEAMCFGLPVITTQMVGAAGDLVRDGVNGFVYPAGDVGTLTQKLELLVRNPALRQRMGRASSEIMTGWGYAQDVDGILACLAALGKLNS